MDSMTLRRVFEAESYVFDETLLTTIYISLKLGKPILVEGAAGVGKTEVAKVLAAAFGVDLIRLQCYEGLDESKSLYEWNYQKQLLNIQLNLKEKEEDKHLRVEDLFSRDFLLERPLLRAINSDKTEVLLIDEVDKSNEEFEAFLLEMLSDFQVSIPELGTVKAKNRPVIILTSNNTRQLTDALKRRCTYLFIDYPSVEKEINIINARLKNVPDKLAGDVAAAVSYLRSSDRIFKKPSIAETLDWVSALMAMGKNKLDKESVEKTLGFLLKNEEDMLELREDEEFGQFLADKHN